MTINSKHNIDTRASKESYHRQSVVSVKKKAEEWLVKKEKPKSTTGKIV